MSKDLQTIDMSNAKRIPIGLGRIQRRIMNFLQAHEDTMYGISILATHVYNPPYKEGQFNYYTKGQYHNIHRAVSALEKRGLVKTQLVPIKRERCRRDYKVVGTRSENFI